MFSGVVVVVCRPSKKDPAYPAAIYASRVQDEQYRAWADHLHDRCVPRAQHVTLLCCDRAVTVLWPCGDRAVTVL